MSAALGPFHLAFPVHDLKAARSFYTGVLGCGVGRESGRWIDFDFFGHQITAHLSPAEAPCTTNPVDGDAVPVRHFGLVLPWDKWQELAARLEANGIDFLVQPKISGKACTFAQLVMVSYVLLAPDLPELLQALVPPLYWLASGLAVVATVDYFRLGKRFAVTHQSE